VSRDVRHPVALDPGLGRLAAESDYGQHIDQMIRQLLLTTPGERVNRPDFGCGLRDMVFAANGQVTAGLTQVAVFQALGEWLGSVIDVEDVAVDAVDEKLEVRIAYVVRARGEHRYLKVEALL
jgi:phage baseplate assembly protein W